MTAKGERRPAIYNAWAGMRHRCNNPRALDYRFYGGRGIKICAAWSRFAQFAADVGPHPGPGWTLDRIDTDGNYEPGNVRWATRQTQARNRNYCGLTEAVAAEIRRLYGPFIPNGRGRRKKGLSITQAQLAARFGVSQTQVSKVLHGDAWA